MEDLSFKSLAVAGMLLGIGAWVFGPHKGSERNLSAAGVTSSRFGANTQTKTAYQPNLNTFSHERDTEDKQLNLINDTAALAPVAQKVAQGSDFENTRLEITKSLVHGNLDDALILAEQKLEESISGGSPDMAYVGYLHEFIMQNAADPDTELDITFTALKGTRDPNLKRFLYKKFQSYLPNQKAELDQQLTDAGIVVE